MCDFQYENESLKKEIEELRLKVKQLEEQLKTNNDNIRQKIYYENHSEEVKQRTKTYYQKLKESNPQKIKEWRRRAYLKSKEKQKFSEEAK